MAKQIFQTVKTLAAPKPIGCYSVAVQADETIYLSGALGMDKDTLKLVPGGIIPETQQLFKNMQAVLQAAGSSFDKVAHVRVYLTNIEDGAEVNKIYGEYFKEPYPARVMLEVSKLPLGAKIEVEAIAFITNKSRI